MFTNWKKKLEKESNQRLFELFSETERINIEPQIYSGNLLFDRDYDVNELRKSKYNLISSIEDSFGKKFTLDKKKNRKENIIRELTFRVSFAMIIFAIFYFAPEFEYNFENLTLKI
jgi:ABC-type multidrug transport system permease subunit